MILGFKQLPPLSVSLLLLLCVLCIWMCWWGCVGGSKGMGLCVNRYRHMLDTCVSEFRGPSKVPVLRVYLIWGNIYLFFLHWGILLSLAISSIMELFRGSILWVLETATQARTLSWQVLSRPHHVTTQYLLQREQCARCFCSLISFSQKYHALNLWLMSYGKTMQTDYQKCAVAPSVSYQARCDS